MWGQDCVDGVEVELWGECYNIEETAELSLVNSGLSGEIPSEIGNLTNLTTLNLGYNQLTGEIPYEIGNLINLTELILSYNQLTGGIPPTIENLIHLTNLRLNNNSLNGSIPQEIGNLLELTRLVLYNNNLTDSIPYTIGNLTNLIHLHLQNNDLTGEIPPEIENLTNLTNISLFNNNLMGIIPPEIGSLTNLIEFSSYHNNLSGSLPEEIGSLLSIEYLNLFGNAFDGEIPPEIGNLTNLTGLYLHNNNLTGEIPPEIGNLTNLTDLFLNTNNLTGEIPHEIGNLVNLEQLDLAINQLNGEIPVSICNISGIIYIYNNNLCPPYPTCIEEYVGEQDISECSSGCDDKVTISNQWSNGLNYDFTYTLGELSDFQGQPLQQIAQKEITSLMVKCQETGQVWLFDSDRIAIGNGNHNFSFLQGRYTDFPFPTRDIANGLLIGIDTYSTGNYHSLWFSVTAIDDEGNEFTHDNYVDPNPYGWYSSNEITFSSLYFTEVVNYSNLDVLYAEGTFPVIDIVYQIGGDGYSNGFVCDETCEGSISGNDCENTVSIELNEGANLVSFSVLPLDSSVENVLSSLGDTIFGLAGEGEATLNTDNGWVGSLTTISYENGYWVLVNAASTLNITGSSIQPDQLYALHTGNNLISYSLTDCGDIGDVLPDAVEDCLYAIAGEGVATMSTDIGWVGSLTSLCANEGYWFVNQCDDIEFTFDEPRRLGRQASLNQPPYPYHQSSEQAFYFIESIANIAVGDWIIAYNEDQVIGARQWEGVMIDIPVMGNNGSDFTRGYIETGSTPQFKLLKNGELIDVEGEVPTWSNNQLYVVPQLAEVIALPEAYSLHKAYPNPFNPVTTISFAIPVDSEVSLSIYNLQGREIISLINGNVEAGYHSVVWNADSQASGVYFIKMIAGEFVNTQKLMLVK